MLINHLGISGGKDSTALLLWAVNESGYAPESLRVTFCDTGNEHPFTYAYVMWLSAKVRRIKWLEPKLKFYDLARKRGRFPSPRVRFCTQELKMHPMSDYLRVLRGEQGHEVLLHTGVRAAESADRAKLPEREFDDYYWCEVYRPLLRWTLADVLAIHARYGIPPNPLYGLTEVLPWSGAPNPYYQDGLGRVSCFPCMMSRKDEIEKIARINPERIDWIGRQERSFKSRCGYSFFFARDKVPLSQRSKEITTASGERMKVCTIEDVARWSKTSRGGVQYKLPIIEQEEMADEPPSCASKFGFCE